MPEERLPEERGGGESTGGQQTGGQQTGGDTMGGDTMGGDTMGGDTMGGQQTGGQQTGGPALPARPSGGPPPGKAVPPLPQQTDPQQSSRQWPIRQWPIRQWPIRQWPVRPPWRRHARAIRAVGAGVAVPALLPAALLAFLLAGAAAAPDARAQTENPAWTDEQGNPGRILVSLDGMTPVSTPRAARFDPATNTFSYWIRTSAAPHSGDPDSDKWWVRIFVGGNIYVGGRIYGCITWEPSVGLGLAGGKWNDWRQVTFHLDKDCVRPAASTDSVPDSVPDTLRITHQVWTNSNWRRWTMQARSCCRSPAGMSRSWSPVPRAWGPKTARPALAPRVRPGNMWPRGGTDRHDGPKIRCRKASRFESRRDHQFQGRRATRGLGRQRIRIRSERHCGITVPNRVATDSHCYDRI